jgi:hypothetical protein
MAIKETMIKETTMDEKKDSMTTVLVNFIQDRSGSMQSAWDETVQGFKTFIEELKSKGAAEGIRYLFSFTTFDTLIEQPIHEQPIEAVNVKEIEKHAPRGSTALYDAVGQALEAVKTVADKYIGVIVTDGYENSSREWDKDRLNKAIEAKLSAGNWSFVYLGTQPETWADAGAIGVSMGASATYAPVMARSAYLSTAKALHSHSVSAALGTRNLFRSHMTQEDAARAGIRLKPDSKPDSVPGPIPPTKPIPQIQKPRVPRRWR